MNLDRSGRRAMTGVAVFAVLAFLAWIMGVGPSHEAH
jgi:hypothetical protein